MCIKTGLQLTLVQSIIHKGDGDDVMRLMLVV